MEYQRSQINQLSMVCLILYNFAVQIILKTLETPDNSVQILLDRVTGMLDFPWGQCRTQSRDNDFPSSINWTNVAPRPTLLASTWTIYPFDISGGFSTGRDCKIALTASSACCSASPISCGSAVPLAELR